MQNGYHVIGQLPAHTVSTVTGAITDHTLCSIVYEPDPVPVLRQVIVLSDGAAG